MEWEPQYPSVPSNPTNLSNQSVGTSGTRSEKVPTLKQISPSPAVSALSKLTDDELRRKGVEDLLRILRRVETDYKSLLGEHGNIVKDVNRRLQIFVLETRSLKEVNQKLQDDNQELRDLCCFLDDDRQRGRKLAREWQRFGRYTASVMRSEVAVYQEKLRELEDKQNELITENMELKELCLFLDQERLRMTGDRDEGDGSSNGTVTGHEDGIVSMETVGSAPTNPNADIYPISPSSTANYIRELELKVCLLEEQKKMLSQRVDRNSADGLDITSSIFDGRSGDHIKATENNQSVHGSKPGTTLLRKSPVSSKPESVMHAMKVLQVHEELEKTPTEDDGLDDPEKAIVREMCNVVWRTLGDPGDIGSFNDSSDSIQEPPFIVDSSSKPSFPIGVDPLYSQGNSYNYTNTQPQSRTTSTPVPVGMKQPNVGNQFLSSATDNYSGPTAYQLQSQRNNSSRSLQENKQQQSSQLLYTQNQNDPVIRNRQDSLSERLASDRSRNLPYKQSIDRPDDMRNPEQKHPAHISQDVSGKTSNQQQLPNHLPLQQPPALSSHQQQHSLPDMGSNVYSQQRSADPMTRSTQQPSQFQQPQIQSAHQLQHSLSEIGTHSHPSQRPSDFTARSLDQTHRYQQRPSPPQQSLSSSSLPVTQNQRSADSQSNKQQSGNIHAQYSELSSTANIAGNQPQHQRNIQARPHQQVKLLDAPGSGRNFQRLPPSQGQLHSKDRVHEESSSQGQTRLHSRGDTDNSTERDTQVHPAPRSMSSSSSSSITNPLNSQLSAHNMPGGKSTQNMKGPSVFRAYPPQLTSMPTQPVAMRASQGHELSSSGGNPNHPDPTRGSYPSEIQSQNKTNIPSKRFQEQEWRQNFLDDSDTL